MGMVKDGRVYLFRDAITSAEDAVRTLWHEFLHYGLRRYLTADQYIADMRRLAAADGYLYQKAKAWEKTNEAKKARLYAEKAHGLSHQVEQYVFARGVDEALADFASSIGPRNNESSGSFVAKTIRAVINWLAKLADRLKCPDIGNWLRGMTNEEAKRYSSTPRITSTPLPDMAPRRLMLRRGCCRRWRRLPGRSAS